MNIYNSEKKCDSKGKTILIEGITGRILDTISLESNIEDLPVTLQNIYKVPIDIIVKIY